MMVRVPSAYNAILGRSGLNTIRAVVLTYHLLVRFSTRYGVGEMREDQQLIRRYFLVSTQNNKPEDSLPVDKLDKKKSGEGWTSWTTDFHPIKKRRSRKNGLNWITITQLRVATINKIAQSQRQYFAWSATDMPEILSEIITSTPMLSRWDRRNNLLLLKDKRSLMKKSTNSAQRTSSEKLHIPTGLPMW